MRMWLALPILALLPLFPPAAFAEDGQAALLAQVRAITRQYDKIATGWGQSEPVSLAQTRDQYARELRGAVSAGNRSQAIRDLAEIFVLSGGDAGVLEPWAHGAEPGSKEAQLFEGVLAYGEGRTSEAENKLFPIDPLSLDAMRGGHLSLALALLTARRSPERAFAYLETAALLLPGQLVEEAALRQTAVLASKTMDEKRLSRSAVCYLQRFRQSAYAGGFETQLAFSIARFPGNGGVAILKEVLTALPHGWGRCLPCFLESVAGQAILLGKADLAIAAASAAIPLVSEDGSDKQRLLLYSGSALIVTDRFQEGLERLHLVQETKLNREDAELLRASLALSGKLRETPMQLTPLKLEVSAPHPKGNRIFSVSSQHTAAMLALARADASLKEAK